MVVLSSAPRMRSFPSRTWQSVLMTPGIPPRHVCSQYLAHCGNDLCLHLEGIPFNMSPAFVHTRVLRWGIARGCISMNLLDNFIHHFRNTRSIRVCLIVHCGRIAIHKLSGPCCFNSSTVNIIIHALKNLRA
jgi:hypothetical protein